MNLSFLGSKCSAPQSIFTFLIKFMLSHSSAFESACSFCPFGYCYKYFFGTYAAFQIIYATKKIFELFQEPSFDDYEDEELLLIVPYLQLPVSLRNFNLICYTLTFTSNLDLFLRTIMSENVEELISFTSISLFLIAFSWYYYYKHFEKFTSSEKIIRLIINIASILNLSFFLCFIFENYKNCTSLY
ncbi:hypothetical protein PVAND_004036 [Polypedilum vanderplanki]|uniref:Uncharacterized protein n=1 Tax=Polypedilum vanderplanki TaxID=319348 RepID=A0A9J6BVW9_POLVA|nr:hypothetical protein PVAND_004036 [Polypedilum vanderplanki]